MTIAEIKAAIEDIEHQYEYSDSTTIHLKDQNGNLKEITGFFVGENGKLFIK